MFFHFPNNDFTLKNPSLDKIIDKLQIGDILTYTNQNDMGHTIMVYNII